MISANGVEYKNLPEQVQYLTERAAEFAVELDRVSASVESVAGDVAALQTSYTTLAEDVRVAKININSLFTNVGTAFSEIANIKNGTTHLFENITDSHGNKRFVEGNFPVESIEGITWMYHKWSLSGTHLMIVLAGKNESETDITFAGNELFGSLQDSTLSYIFNKIHTLTNNNLVSTAMFRTYLNFRATEKGNLTLAKPSANHLIIINWNRAVTDIPAGSAFRVQFDLLIDAS